MGDMWVVEGTNARCLAPREVELMSQIFMGCRIADLAGFGNND